MENAAFHIPKLETPKISTSTWLENALSELCSFVSGLGGNLFFFLFFFFHAPCLFLPKH